MTFSKSGHYREVSKPNRCYSSKFVGAVIAVDTVSNLMSGVLQFYSQVGHILSLVTSER